MKFLLSFLIILELCSAAKILFIIPMPSKSHYILGERIIEELVKRGHEVTLISPFKRANPLKNLTEIVTPNCFEKLSLVKENKVDEVLKLVNGIKENGVRALMGLFSFTGEKHLSVGEILFDETMNSTVTTEFLNSNPKFDLVIGECFMADGLIAGFAHRTNASMAAFSTFIPNVWANELVGNPAPTSYIPEPILDYTEHMSFVQRLINFVYSTGAHLAYYYLQVPSQNRLMKKYFGEDMPELRDLLKNTSLVLVNHHYSLAFPRPYLPNMVEIGSFHVKPVKPLPKDLQQFIDEANDGVILFSMGSNLRSSDLPPEKLEGVLNIFSKLKQRVLWKFEAENIQNLPPNVKILKWIPQSDVLGHPNVRLFITHGGLLSTTETVLRGVPILGVPIFGDQPMNMKQVEKLGIGRSMKYEDIGEDVMYELIQEILNDPKYTRNIKYRSMLLQDVPMSQIDTAMYWIEYVIRHKGAPHMRSAAQDLSWYQLYLVDVFVAVMAVVVAISSALSFCIKFLLKMFRGQKNVSPEKKKN